MQVFVTGATGFIGQHLCIALASRGNTVHALYRSEIKIPGSPPVGVRYFKGDITDRESLEIGMKGCKAVFHLAAYAKVWARDPETFRKLNYEGTIRVLEAAVATGVKRVLLCSTAAVFGPSINGNVVNEETKRTITYFSRYERWKDISDQEAVRQFASRVEICFVCPTRVFGPGIISESNTVTLLICNYLLGKFHFLPGNGQSVGNYVYIDDVVSGMLLTMERGKCNEHYILGGENASYNEFFSLIADISGKRFRMIKVPAGLIILLAAFMLAGGYLFRIPPRLTPGWARKYLYDWHVGIHKAVSELGYSPIPLREGIRKTVQWLKDQDLSSKG
jgi:farnesol dehydrogenase